MKREIKFRAFNKQFNEMVYQGNRWVKDLSSFAKAWENEHIMQYVGFKDYFGKEIYEGDVCRYDLIDFGPDLIDLTSLEGVVEYKDGCFFLNGLDYRPSLKNYCIRYLTVIGNIYENPDLIKNSSAD